MRTENQASKLKKKMMKARKVNIDDIIKDIILGIIRDKETNPDDGFAIFNAIIAFFQNEVQIDIFRLFAVNKNPQDGADETQNNGAHVQNVQEILQKMGIVKTGSNFKAL
jgi:hypothetical protein